MLLGLAYLTTLIVEACALFAIWNWRRRLRSLAWLIGGAAALIALIAFMAVRPIPLSTRIYFAFAGTYFVSALVWAWTLEDIKPAEWKLGEVFVASLAGVMFVLAAFGTLAAS